MDTNFDTLLLLDELDFEDLISLSCYHCKIELEAAKAIVNSVQPCPHCGLPIRIEKALTGVT